MRRGKSYSRSDLAEVSDNPEWTAEDMAAAMPFSEALPELAATLRRERSGGEPSVTKVVSLRLDQEVIDKFMASGPGWQAKINDVLKRVKL